VFHLFFGLWILNAFTIRVSGAHFNPAVSFAYSMRKDDKGISRKLALAYIIA
jgi:glycerol uptake facilitator-like aquaporin